MVSIKLKFRPSTVVGKEGHLFYQIICKRMVRHIPTEYKIMPCEWDPENEKLVHHLIDWRESGYLSVIQRRVNWDLNRLAHIVEHLSTSTFTADDIVRAFHDGTSEVTFFSYMQDMVARLWKQGQYRTSETYAVTLNSFRNFREGVDLYFEEIDSNLLLAYEYYLKAKSLTPNTISFYMKRLRAVYNKAVDDGYILNKNPFKRVFTSSEKTVKRAIRLRHLKQLKELNLKESSSKCFARDMFLFSFYTRGMSFIDIAYLRKKDLKGGMLTYRRKKTGQLLSLHWEPCMQTIVDRYPSDAFSPYLLSIIDNRGGDIRKQYRNVQTLVNRNLKEIGQKLGFSIPLTMYVARHSWASIARQEGIPISVISAGMGHDSERTTQIYLASLDFRTIDQANRKILKLL